VIELGKETMQQEAAAACVSVWNLKKDVAADVAAIINLQQCSALRRAKRFRILQIHRREACTTLKV
jgi:hypothetical protein